MGLFSGIFRGIKAIATFGGSEAARAQGKAAAAQREANDIQRRQQAAQQARERRQQIQEARIRQAQVIQSAANTGGLNSSSVIGGVGSVGSQMSTNLGFLWSQEALAGQYTFLQNRASKFNNQANKWLVYGGAAKELGERAAKAYAAGGGGGG